MKEHTPNFRIGQDFNAENPTLGALSGFCEVLSEGESGKFLAPGSTPYGLVKSVENPRRSKRVHHPVDDLYKNCRGSACAPKPFATNQA